MSVEMSKPVPRPGILDIAAYVPGKEHAPGVARVYKLSSNETPLAPAQRQSKPSGRLPTIWAVILTGRP